MSEEIPTDSDAKLLLHFSEKVLQEKYTYILAYNINYRELSTSKSALEKEVVNNI